MANTAAYSGLRWGELAALTIHAAQDAKLAPAGSGLVTADGCRLAGSGPLARAIARSITGAGLTMHHCAPHDPLSRPGGACLLPVPAGPAGSRAGITCPRATHSLLCLDGDRHGPHAGTRQAMNTAIGCILRAFGYAAGAFGSGGAWLVTGHRHQQTGAGR